MTDEKKIQLRSPLADNIGSLQATSKDALRRMAEAALLEKPNQLPEISEEIQPEAMMKVRHELSVYEIELELQNDNLIRSQENLAVLLTRYESLYDFAPVGYCTVQQSDGLFLEANLTAATMLGVNRRLLLRKKITNFILREDQDSYYLLCNRIFLNGSERQSCELRMVKHDGTIMWVYLVAEAQHNVAAPELRIILYDISDKKREEALILANAALQATLLEKEALLKELHHRVKNDLQLIASILKLESRKIEHHTTKAMLTDMHGRICSIALLNESLYHYGDFTTLDLGAYLKQLSTQIFHMLTTHDGSIKLHLDLTPVQVGVDQALPCGLIVNELVTNCLKHGFPEGRAGEIRIELHPMDDGPQWQLRVSDTGVGLPDDFASKQSLSKSHSIGLQLMSDLVKQLGGSLEIGSGTAAVFTVKFVPARG